MTLRHYIARPQIGEYFLYEEGEQQALIDYVAANYSPSITHTVNADNSVTFHLGYYGDVRVHIGDIFDGISAGTPTAYNMQEVPSAGPLDYAVTNPG
jgi:hypothetical protein